MNQIKFLGSFYWNEKIGVGNLIANDFDFKNKIKKVKILKDENLCECGNLGRDIIFDFNGKRYGFVFMSGYPCQCR